jgi:hypothetical protein
MLGSRLAMSSRWVYARVCFALLSFSGCSLDLESKAACATANDCLSGFVCIQNRCERPSDVESSAGASFAGAGANSAAGSAPAAAGAFASAAGAKASAEDAGAAGFAEECEDCGPRLLALVPSEGSLSPAFAGTRSEYTLSLPLLADSVAFAVTVASDVNVAINGAAFDASAASPAVAVPLGSTRIELALSEAGLPTRTYAVSVTRGTGFEQTAYVKPSLSLVQQSFGFHLALADDTLVVGLGNSGINGVDIFHDADGVWSFQTRLAPAHGEDFDAFGRGIALLDDTLIIGAPLEDSADRVIGGDQLNNDALNSGAVYVFTRSGNEWQERAFLKAKNGDPMDLFGSAVALSRDPDGGYILAVGAPGEASAARQVNGDAEDNSAPEAGAVYVFGGHDGSWAELAYLKASNATTAPAHQPGAQFGATLSLSGTSLLVGALDESGSATGVNGPQQAFDSAGSGAAYVFQRSAAGWAQQAYLKASNTDAWDNFGTSVAIDGPRLAVGAYYERSTGRGVGALQQSELNHASGAVYTFELDGSGWHQDAFIKSSNSDEGDGFGQAVALHENLLAVSANRESSKSSDPSDNSAVGAGAAYLFTHGAQGWVERAYLKASNAGGQSGSGVGDGFGQDLALSAGRLVVGAPYECSDALLVDGDQNNDAATSAGAVYVFE